MWNIKLLESGVTWETDLWARLGASIVIVLIESTWSVSLCKSARASSLENLRSRYVTHVTNTMPPVYACLCICMSMCVHVEVYTCVWCIHLCVYVVCVCMHMCIFIYVFVCAIYVSVWHVCVVVWCVCVCSVSPQGKSLTSILGMSHLRRSGRPWRLSWSSGCCAVWKDTDSAPAAFHLYTLTLPSQWTESAGKGT